jgi:transposase
LCRYLRFLYPPATRIAIICDNFSPHLTTAKDTRVGTWAKANNVEIAYTPTNSSWLNRIEAQFTALRYRALDGTDHATHKEQASMIRRYIIWRNNHAYDPPFRAVLGSYRMRHPPASPCSLARNDGGQAPGDGARRAGGKLGLGHGQGMARRWIVGANAGQGVVHRVEGKRVKPG